VTLNAAGVILVAEATFDNNDATSSRVSVAAVVDDVVCCGAGRVFVVAVVSGAAERVGGMSAYFVWVILECRRH
jgi:hypothetical protein